MKITLPAELAKVVRAKLAAGVYADEGEVVREALRALRREELARENGVAVIRRELAEAAAQLDRGEGRVFDPKATKRRARERAASIKAAVRAQRSQPSSRSSLRKKSA